MEESQPEILPEEPAATPATGGMVGIVKPLAEFPAGNRSQAEQLLVKGLDQYDQEQLDVALAFYQRAIDADLSFSMAHNSLGMVLIDLERYPEAIEAIKNAIRIDPKNSEALSNLGFVYRRTGNDTQAATAYMQYLALEPDDEQGPKIRGWAEGIQAQMGGKLPDLDLSLPASAAPAKPKPAAKPAAKASATPAPMAPAAPAKAAHESLPKSDKPPAKPVPLPPIPSAGPRATGAVSAAPPPLGSGARPSAAPPPRASAAAPVAATSAEALDPQELYEEMLDFFDHEDFAQVRTYAKKILEIDSTHLSTRIIEGKVLTCEKNYQDAVVFFANLLESAPKDPSIYYFLGYCLRALEQDMEAAEAFTKYLELMPNAVDAQKTAMWIQKVTGKPMGARSTAPGGVTQPAPIATGRAAGAGLEKTFVYIPSESEVEVQEELAEKDLKKFQRGVTAFQEGNLEGAQKYLDQFLSEHEKYSDAHVLKARIQLRNREYDQAITSIQRAIQLNPTSSEAYYYLGQAYEKHGKLAESRACYQRTLELEPEGPRADHLREWLDRAQQAAAAQQAEVICERCLRKFEVRYVAQYEDKNTCRWCLDLIEAQVGGGLVATHFPDLVREEEERDAVEGATAGAWRSTPEAAAGGNKKLILIAVLLIVVLGGGLGAWALLKKPKDIDPGQDPNNGGTHPPTDIKKFEKDKFKLALIAAKTELIPDEAFEADVGLEGAQEDLAEVSLELEGCPDGVHFSADRKKILWQTPPAYDPILVNPTNPFKLTVVAIAKDKQTKRKLATLTADVVISVQKMDSAVSEAKNFSWVHDQPQRLLPMERMTWQIQGRATGTLQLQAKIVNAPKGAAIAMVNGVPTMTWQSPLVTSVEALKTPTTYDFELEMSVAKKEQPGTTFFAKPYKFTIAIGWSISSAREVDLKVDPMDQVQLAAGNLVQAPGEYPDDVLVATGRPLKTGSLHYLDFIDAGDTLTMNEAFALKLPGFPYGVFAGPMTAGKNNRDDVLVIDLFRRSLVLVPQEANGLPASQGTSVGLPATPGDLLLMDVNRDGKNDLVRTDMHGNKLYVSLMGADGKLARNGDGNLTALECPVDDYAAPVRLVNLRARNRLALISGAPSGRVKVQLLEAKWPPPGPAPIVSVGTPNTEIGADGARYFIDAVMLTTADREWLGVVTGGDQSSTLEVFRPLGDALQHRPADPNTLGSLTLPGDIDAPPKHATAVDLNRDGLDDLVIGYPHRIDIYWQISGETSKWLLVHSLTDKNFTGDFVLADVNRDARLDLVVYDARQKLDVFLIK